ncbi:MAG TPA: PEGA domain-containing protein [Terriglobia bacterium]|nr:PEGA domain-containing protein [Terriglobia bacterium]
MPKLSIFPLRIFTTATILVGMVAGATLSIANPRGNSSVGRSIGASINAASASGGYYGGYGYGGYGGYGYGDYGGGYYTPYGGGPYAPGYSVDPTHWWTGPNGSTDGRGEGYNPNAGYAWDTVSTMLLQTNPPKARVTLDGIYVGTTDSLGPFQLPVGNHTLRIEAAGFEPSETVLRVVEPILRQLLVNLTPVTHGNKPAPAK